MEPFFFLGNLNVSFPSTYVPSRQKLSPNLLLEQSQQIKMTFMKKIIFPVSQSLKDN
jgi:hypothetical protein